MTHIPSRRAFLQCLSSAVAGTAATALVPARLPAIEPIERHGGPKFKFSLAAYSYRDLLLGKPPASSSSKISSTTAPRCTSKGPS